MKYKYCRYQAYQDLKLRATRKLQKIMDPNLLLALQIINLQLIMRKWPQWYLVCGAIYSYIHMHALDCKFILGCVQGWGVFLSFFLIYIITMYLSTLITFFKCNFIVISRGLTGPLCDSMGGRVGNRSSWWGNCESIRPPISHLPFVAANQP